MRVHVLAECIMKIGPEASSNLFDLEGVLELPVLGLFAAEVQRPCIRDEEVDPSATELHMAGVHAVKDLPLASETEEDEYSSSLPLIEELMDIRPTAAMPVSADLGYGFVDQDREICIIPGTFIYG